jgi:aminoglycoside phosphotransferase (APT) family kinase protein
VTTPERQAALLTLTGGYLRGVAPAVADPQAAALLGYLTALVDRAAVDAGAARRRAERDKTVADLSGHAPLADVLSDLVKFESGGDADAATRLRTLLSELAYLEDGAPVTPAATSAETGPDTDAVATYLSGRHGSAVDDLVLTKDASGFYMHTYFASYSAGGHRHEVVLRQLPAGIPAEELEREYAVLRAVWSPELPVPEPLWYEADPTVLGGPFIASRRVTGATLGTFAGATQPVDARIGPQLAGLLATLHARELPNLEPPIPPMRTHGEIAAAIDNLEALATRSTSAVSPRLTALFAWLRTHLPPTPGRPSLLHGDVGFHNLLIEGAEIRALLDWQRAHFGDPAEELAYLRPAIEPVFGWESFLADYVAAGGHPPDAGALHFYTVWQDTWRAVECLPRAQMFDREPSLMTAMAGFVMGPQFLNAALATAFGPTTPDQGD